MADDDCDVRHDDGGEVVSINTYNESSSSSSSSLDRLLLQPEEAGILDLILLLWSSDVESRKFIDCSEQGDPQDFHPRWLIFISVVFQKLFLLSKGTMDRVGRGLEMWLNLLSSNGGLLNLCFNLFKGEVEWPERSSAAFTSLIGNLDQRVEIEKNIRPGHRRYKAVLSMMAAKLSYENEAFVKSVVEGRWNMKFEGFYNFWNGKKLELVRLYFRLKLKNDEIFHLKE